MLVVAEIREMLDDGWMVGEEGRVFGVVMVVFCRLGHCGSV